MIGILIERGADYNAKFSNGETLLHRAAGGGGDYFFFNLKYFSGFLVIL